MDHMDPYDLEEDVRHLLDYNNYHYQAVYLPEAERRCHAAHYAQSHSGVNEVDEARHPDKRKPASTAKEGGKPGPLAELTSINKDIKSS